MSIWIISLLMCVNKFHNYYCHKCFQSHTIYGPIWYSFNTSWNKTGCCRWQVPVFQIKNKIREVLIFTSWGAATNSGGEKSNDQWRGQNNLEESLAKYFELSQYFKVPKIIFFHSFWVLWAILIFGLKGRVHNLWTGGPGKK